MTKLSVNLNKIALIRNSRGGNNPDLIKVAMDCESFGAQGITIHPRPDQRHARYEDIPLLKSVVKTELNIEGYPSEEFIYHVLHHAPHQVTLVPDPPGAKTSDHGWDTYKNQEFLVNTIDKLKSKGIRTSIFIDADPIMVAGAKATGTDRIELYTGPYAHDFNADPEKAIASFIEAALEAKKQGLGLNAGHDLNLKNLAYFKKHIPGLLEVSIGHALVIDALYLGLKMTIEEYLAILV